MLLKINAISPMPTVLFNVAFPALPQTVPLPAGWNAQLQRVFNDDLEQPRCLHSLDKAGWAVSLLQEVTFHMSTRSVTCLFVDGVREDWSLSAEPCLRALQRVLDDVTESAIAAEYEHEMRLPQPVSVPVPVVAPTPTKPTRHKKQRSLLMMLVSSLIPSSSSSPPPPQEPEKPPPKPNPPRPPPKHSSQFYRRRARATLVDTYRRYVLSNLTSRAPPGGYCTWVTRSLLLRVQSRMNTLVDETGGNVPDLLPSAHDLRPSPSSISSTPFFEDDLSVTDTDTDTDYSSIHTPQASLTDHRPPWNTHTNGSGTSSVPRSPSPPVSGEDIAEYAMLHACTVRLRALLLRFDAAERGIAAERAEILEMLKVKSRRRAWLNRTLLGGAAARDAGLATPYVSSPLASCTPINPDTPESALSPAVALPARYLKVASAPHDVSSLFPIEEGADEESFPSDVDYQPEFDHDHELYARPMPRIRANSLGRAHAAALALDARTEEPPTVFQPPASVQVRVFDSRGGFDVESGGAGCDEFTLALDVKPFPRRRSVGSGCPRFERNEWLAGPGAIVDCR